jgi:hypothetical protein
VFNFIVNQYEPKRELIKNTLYRSLYLNSTVYSLHAIEHICKILIMVHFAYARSPSRGAAVGSPRGYGGPQAPSCVGANIVYEQGNPWCILSIILDFFLNYYLYVKIECALSL